ncbi:MAG: four helix bundle protein [Saprospiraceae bacterium]|jgi:four helix bundle protein
MKWLNVKRSKIEPLLGSGTLHIFTTDFLPTQNVSFKNNRQFLWNLVSTWDYFLKDTIGTQMTRSVDSIGTNKAEGFGRFHYKENKRFCYFSRGSLFETIVWLGKCKGRNIIPEAQANRLIKSLYDLNDGRRPFPKPTVFFQSLDFHKRPTNNPMPHFRFYKISACNPI